MNTPDQLVEHVKQATDYQLNRILLKEKILEQLHMPYENGMFKLTPALLAFVSTWPTEILYLEDVYENPIEINKQVFLVKAQQHYQATMNFWHTEHAKLKQIRKV